MTQRQPVLFLGHGSPMAVITDSPERSAFVALGRALPRPRAILCITAHWETMGKTHLTTGAFPRTIHDFRGFPRELYEMTYPAPGAEDLASRMESLIGKDVVVHDETWGFDHGVWGVLQPMYPAADIPVMAMSLDRSLDPSGHAEMGRRLGTLRDDGILIIGSGNVVHNLGLWRQSAGTQPDWVLDFQARTNRAVVEGDIASLTTVAPGDRAAALAINSGEHYLPLLYAAGARLPDDGVKVFNDSVDGALSMTSYLIGDAISAEGPAQ